MPNNRSRKLKVPPANIIKTFFSSLGIKKEILSQDGYDKKDIIDYTKRLAVDIGLTYGVDIEHIVIYGEELLYRLVEMYLLNVIIGTKIMEMSDAEYQKYCELYYQPYIECLKDAERIIKTLVAFKSEEENFELLSLERIFVRSKEIDFNNNNLNTAFEIKKRI